MGTFLSFKSAWFYSWTHYYGTDWIGNILVILSILLITNQKRVGFLCCATANALFLIFGWQATSIPTILFNIILMIVNIRGYILWGNTSKA